MPAEGESYPAKIFKRVDLPLPEAPTIAIISPKLTDNSRPLNATTSTSTVL